MPARKTWLLRVREILEELAGLQVPVVDRAVFERLFGVRRRRAIQLMGFFGGFQSGRTYLVDRLDLIRQLEPIEASAEFEAEQRRRQRLVESLEQLRHDRAATRVTIQVQRATTEKAIGLPAGMSLQPGRMMVDFEGTEDLLSKLYALVQLAARDFDRLRMILDSGGARSPSARPTTPPTAQTAGSAVV